MNFLENNYLDYLDGAQLNYLRCSLVGMQCDFLIQDLVPTFQRNKVVDLTTYWIYGDLAFLIPASDETANIGAVVKPFQWPVWLGLGLSIAFVIAVLNLIQRYPEYAIETIVRQNEKTNQTGGRLRVTKWQTGKQYLFVFGNLLSQGGFCPSKWLPYRLVTGVWTLAAFFFVQAYTSTLITYVVTPVHQPLITSAYDIAERSEIQLFVRKAGTPDAIISNKNNTGLNLKLLERLNSNPNSRCTFASDCINMVIPGSRNVFVDASIYLQDAIRDGFQKTGKCNLQIAKGTFMPVFSTFALPKNSPHTKSIDQGLLELQQTGMIDYWDLWFRPMPPQCTGNVHSGKQMPKNKLKPLSLKNLTGAFLVIAVGFGLSLLAFLGEKIISLRESRRKHKQTSTGKQ
ncbi:ionotropic receptor 21a-like [Daphnia pulicaria]|uniref:ionotropic receptor 21a-like n=1 Tax=Daphnia pulicaria TaxID=35523 RepID=UPI001EEC225F|nr:ionotropic receptor 21a-like [Daphnia pulicaria]